MEKGRKKIYSRIQVAIDQLTRGSSWPAACLLNSSHCPEAKPRREILYRCRVDKSMLAEVPGGTVDTVCTVCTLDSRYIHSRFLLQFFFLECSSLA